MAFRRFSFTRSLSTHPPRIMILKDSSSSCRCNFFFLLPMVLAFMSSTFLFLYMSNYTTSKLYMNNQAAGLTRVVSHVGNLRPLDIFLHPDREAAVKVAVESRASVVNNESLVVREQVDIVKNESTRSDIVVNIGGLHHELEEEQVNIIKKNESTRSDTVVNNNGRHEHEEIDMITQSSSIKTPSSSSITSTAEDNGVYHDTNLFMQEYGKMKKTLKIYAYPHKKDDPFANILLPVNGEPGGNYASESYFKKALFHSRFLTNDPSEADLFYLPFSIASLRNDKRIGVGGIQNFVRDYILNISRNYPFWNRTNGADHFYVSCHSVSRTAMEKAVEVKLNAIQLVCSSSYFLQGYVAHKDASIPQIWPRKGEPTIRLPSERKTTAFYAGAMNSKVREFLVQTYKNDTEISVHRSHLKTPYSESFLGSRFCIHAKGFEVNTARIGDALYYGCVPVILADFYDLPFGDILNWNNFSVVVSASDIPKLKKILRGISFDEYLKLHENVMRVRKHFQWHDMPKDYDTFNMVMYELWLRRSHLRIQL